jgi:hypothetical protein
MRKLVLNYADSNLPTFITRVVEVDEPVSWDEETTQEEKQIWENDQVELNFETGANGAEQVLVFKSWKEE